ncbi:MAG: hypothetical protein ACI9ES_001385 [Oceanospirillaceae bacterium]|jgi:hypothetical protein
MYHNLQGKKEMGLPSVFLSLEPLWRGFVEHKVKYSQIFYGNTIKCLLCVKPCILPKAEIDQRTLLTWSGNILFNSVE